MIAIQERFSCPSGTSLYKFYTFLPFAGQGPILMSPVVNNLNEY